MDNATINAHPPITITTTTTTTKRCREPLPCGHSCAARCGVCTRITLGQREEQQHESATEAKAATRCGWAEAAELAAGAEATRTAATDPVAGTATTTGQDKDATRREATVAAARAKTHHDICSNVSLGSVPAKCGSAQRLFSGATWVF